MRRVSNIEGVIAMSDTGSTWLTQQGYEQRRPRRHRTFLLANREAHQVHETMKVYSPDSPLGRALLGARENDTRDYFMPGGGTKSVTLLKAKPFRE
jgi:transcription elongation GreA/GreB family factor